MTKVSYFHMEGTYPSKHSVESNSSEQIEIQYIVNTVTWVFNWLGVQMNTFSFRCLSYFWKYVLSSYTILKMEPIMFIVHTENGQKKYSELKYVCAIALFTVSISTMHENLWKCRQSSESKILLCYFYIREVLEICFCSTWIMSQFWYTCWGD